MKVTELIENGIEKRMEAIWTAIPAIVVKIDLATMHCDVRPKMKVTNPQTEQLEELPILQGVPISFQKGAGSVLLMPPEVGDVILVLFSKYALDNMLKDKQTVDHDDVRRFSIDDCVIVSGLYTSIDTIPALSTGEMGLFHKSGSCIKFSASGNIELKAPRIDFTEL
jgi:hypothetical protein